jgi:rare lipoprotein A
MRRFLLAQAIVIVAFVALCAGALAETGIASYYGPESGNVTANGERFRPDGISCAHRTLPFGTVVRVTDRATGRSVVCRINDRGPYVRGRVIDLSRGAARRLGIIKRGVARVKVEILDRRP